ncbi:MAG: Adenine deaminase [Gemmatimonadaceae bacterium]|nr:Adenine deaminase [Gemmatimonadaceae bacterium]
MKTHRMIAAALVCAAPVLGAQSLVIRNATVVPVTGPRIPNATIVVQNGRIAAIGPNLPISSDATVIEGSGLFVYPGLIDSGTRLGLTEVGGVPGPDDTRELGEFNPQDVVLTAVNPSSEHIAITRANGITSAITSATGGLVSGIAALIDLAGWTPNDMAAKARAGMVVNWPSAAPPRGFGGFGFGPPRSPAERQAEYVRQVRDIYRYFDDARAYAEVKARATANGATLPTSFRIDLKMEALTPVVRGEMPVIVEASNAQQIRDALTFADSAKVRIVIRGGTEAWQLADALAAKRVPVVIAPLTSVPGGDEPYDAVYANPGVLSKAGVLIAFESGSASSARDLPYHAGLAEAFGLSGDDALKAITINPAKIWGVDKDYGSIEAGKVANLIVTTGDPIDIRSLIKEVIVRGQRMPFNDRHTRLYEQYRARPKPKP